MFALPNLRLHPRRLRAAGAVAASLVTLLVASPFASAQPPNPSNPVKLIKGVVSEVRSGTPVDGGRVFVYHGSKPEPVAQSRINPSTGAFQVVLGPSSEYRFVLRSNRFLPTETTVRTPDGANYEEVVRNLTMEPIPVGRTLYSGRLFDAGSDVVRSSPELASALAFLKQSQAATLTITVTGDPAGKAKAPAKAAKAPKKKKKSKKGAAAEETPSASTTATTASPAATLVRSRVNALRAFMQKEGISLTRIEWDDKAQPASNSKENVVITIRGIDVEEVEEDS